MLIIYIFHLPKVQVFQTQQGHSERQAWISLGAFLKENLTVFCTIKKGVALMYLDACICPLPDIIS